MKRQKGATLLELLTVLGLTASASYSIMELAEYASAQANSHISTLQTHRSAIEDISKTRSNN